MSRHDELDVHVHIKLAREDDGRWIAEASMPGEFNGASVLMYGRTRFKAVSAALSVMAELILADDKEEP